MYRKTIIVSTILFMSGCADIGTQLGNALIDGLTEGLTGEKKNDTPLTKNEKTWNKCMQKQKQELKTIGIYDSNLNKGATELCGKELGFNFKHQIDIEKNKRNPDLNKKVEACMKKHSDFKGKGGAKKFCEGLVILKPHQQCEIEQMLITGQSYGNSACKNIK